MSEVRNHGAEPRIAFCTTCKGRAEHVKLTLPRNLYDNRSYRNCVFVIVDYNSPDDLRDFLEANPGGEDAIRSGRLVVYHYREPGPFHVSHAKNMAARCGIMEGADILVTLDADNCTGPDFARYVADRFQYEDVLVPAPSGSRIFMCPNFPLIQSLPHGPSRPLRGFAGRLAIRSQDFIKAGGYDEAFDVWGSEDIDMISRLNRMGYNMQHIDNCYLNAIPHSAEVRFKEYPHARRYENKGHLKVLAARTGTVVNYGKFGVGTVYRNYGSAPTSLGPVPTRIFGIGMHKTATTSLHAAFQILGFDSLHWGTGEAPRIWQEMGSGGRSKTLEQWYALSDLPIPLLYRALDQAYPGSKFILTVRDEQAWIRSVEKLWDAKYNPTRWIWDVYPFSNRIHTVLYGQKDFDAEVFLARYRRHNAEVLEYFRDRPGDLLVMDMDAGAGWVELCGFLGAPIPPVPYPAKNTSGPKANAEYKSWIASPRASYAMEEPVAGHMFSGNGEGI